MPVMARLALVSALTALIPGALAWLIKRGTPERLEGVSGIINPG
jgi:hypothetical protein